MAMAQKAELPHLVVEVQAELDERARRKRRLRARPALERTVRILVNDGQPVRGTARVKYEAQNI